MDTAYAFIIVLVTILVASIIGLTIRYFRAEKVAKQSRIKTCTLCDKRVDPSVAEMRGQIPIFPCTEYCGRYICRGCYAGSKKCTECWIESYENNS